MGLMAENRLTIVGVISAIVLISMILIWSISPLTSAQSESLDHEIFEISWSDDDDDEDDDDEDDDDEDDDDEDDDDEDDDDEDDDDEDDDDESEKESKNQISSSFNIPMIKFLLYLLVFIIAINYRSYSKKES